MEEKEMTGRETIKGMIKKAVANQIDGRTGYEATKWIRDYELNAAIDGVIYAINRMIDAGMIAEDEYSQCSGWIYSAADDYIKKEHIVVVADENMDAFTAVTETIYEVETAEETAKTEADLVKAKKIARKAETAILSMDIDIAWIPALSWYIDREKKIVDEKLDFVKKWR